jgi:hypothetical protein
MSLRALACLALISAAASAVPVTHAQQIVPLISFTNVWRYDQSGTDLGTAWRTAGYNDAAWPSGRGLLGFESTPAAYPVPFNTTLDLYLPGGPPGTQVTNYYFRAHFNWALTSTPGVLLVASNLVDDGCVVFLNGAEAARIRVPAFQNVATLATGGPPIEGQYEVTNVNPALLLSGDNVVAVEVHQASAVSGDIAWGMSLTALVPQPLVITNQPRSLTNTVGTSATFSVGVSGGPVSYQWRKDGINIAGATSASYTIPSAKVSDSGIYSVTVSNVLGRIASSNAVLVVIADTSGPKLLSAIVSEGGTTNRIIVSVNERLLSSSVTYTGNYAITLFGTTNRVPVTGAIYGPPLLIVLQVSTNNWFIGGQSNYILTVNNIRDLNTNVIAPDTQIAIAWPRHTLVVPASTVWHFHAAAIFDDNVFNERWYACDYVEGPWWAQGVAPFCNAFWATNNCLGVCQTTLSFQPEPVLFRTSFVWPTESGASASLRVAHVVEDGAIFYLNGQEILRYNVPPGSTPPSASARSSTDVGIAVCVTNSVSVTNLMAGTNWLAVAVLNSAVPQDATVVFALQVDAVVYVAGPLPDSPSPILNIAATGANQVRLSWVGAGYALESATNLVRDTSSPLPGAWIEVPSMANPYTNIAADPQRFYRLRK